MFYRYIGRIVAGIYLGVVCSPNLYAAVIGSLESLPREGVEGESANRAVVDGVEFVVDKDTPLDSFLVRNGGVLNIRNGEVKSVLSQRSSINVESGILFGELNLRSSNLLADKLSIKNEGGTGLIVGIDFPARNPLLTPSNARLTNSEINGFGMGATVGADSLLLIDNSIVVGAGFNQGGETGDGAGVGVSGANLKALNHSEIAGQKNGIFVTVDRVHVGGGVEEVLFQKSNVVIDASKVTGLEGAAIKVTSLHNTSAIADISIQNNSTLNAGNGNLLEVQNSVANFNVDNSRLNGHLTADDTSTLNVTLQNGAQLNGNIVNGNTLAINSGAQWTLQGDNQARSLTMNGGRVSFGEGPHKQLSLNELSGVGVFDMRINTDHGLGDFLNVSGQATGNYGLNIQNTGVEVVTPDMQEIQVVHTGGGNAQFGLVGDRVDLGAYSYELEQRSTEFGNDWFVVGSGKTISPSTRSVLALFNAAPTIWNSELNTLRSRISDVRSNKQQTGGWIRAYGSRFNATTSEGVDYRQKQSGLSLGVDAPLNVGTGQLSLGLMAGYSNNDLDIGRGTNGKVDSYYVGGYGTWLLEEGYYLDGVLKLNRFRNESDVAMSDGSKAKGDYNNTGIGGSLEFGRHMRFADGYFVEPFAQLSSVWVNGTRYTLSNGLQAKNDYTQSVMGKLGTSVGRSIALKDGGVLKPYLRVALAHEFSRSNEVNVNNARFDNHLFGSRGEIGGGVSVSLSERLQLNADLDYMNGKHVEQPWGANVGVKFTF